MLEGRADLTLYDSPRFRDADFQRAIREGTLDKLLGELPVAGRARGKNMIFSWFACYSFYGLMSAGDCTDPYDGNHGGNPPCCYFGTILLNTNTSVPTYQEFNNDYVGLHQPSYTANSGSAGKRFAYDTIETPYYKSDPSGTGREDISARHRFLYLPSEGISSSINSLGILYTGNRDATGGISRASAARLRLKNPAGIPMTINKTGNQVLLVEYTFFLTTA